MNLLDLAVKVTVDDQASDRISSLSDSITGKLGSAAKVAAGAVAASVAAAGAGVATLGKQALEGYASFEQLEGGIDKLFGTGGKNLEEYAASVNKSVGEAEGDFAALSAAHNLVMHNAQNAYATAGMSANDYMENVSGFAAALTNSLGGDTIKAAEQADVAMRAISDNVNTFGTNIDSVSYAFQGFARGSYAMLDNLKLGYGGNQEEMQRLIDDANEWGAANGRASNLSINSFSDVVTAIQQIQEKQQIAGTTAREASQTIEGSINATKAAWSNFLVELGKEDGDIGTRLTELAESAGNVVDNVIPRIAQIGEGMAQALPIIIPKAMELGGQILSSVAAGIGAALPAIVQGLSDGLVMLATSIHDTLASALSGGDDGGGMLEAAMGMIQTLGNAFMEAAPLLLESAAMLLGYILQAIVEFLPTLAESAMGLVNTLVSAVMENGPSMLSAAGEFIGQLLNGILQNLPAIVSALAEGIVTLVSTVISNAPAMLVAAGEFILSILSAIVTNLPNIIMALGEGVLTLIKGVIEHVPDMLAAGVEFIGGLVTAIGNALPDLVSAIGGIIQGGIDAVGGFVSDMLQAGADLVQGLIDGIWNNIGGVADALMGGLGDMVDQALGFLGIHSPSRLFNWVGDMSMEGMAEGIEETAGKAEQAMRKAADNVYAAASGEVDLAVSSGKFDFQTAPGTLGEPQISINIGEFVNQTEQDVRTLSIRLGELTAAEMKARGYAW